VRAVLPREVTPEQLRAALEAAAVGLVVVQPSELDTILPATVGSSTAVDELPEPLTRREREVLQMLAAGLGNKEIAVRLVISDHTVKFHVASILGKLGVSTRTEAVSAGIRRGLVML
jgi:DNA-binding NarL/FixJ family response regulator